MSMFLASNSSNYIKDLILDNISMYVEFYEEEAMYAGIFFSESNTTLFENIKIKNSIIELYPYKLNSYVGSLVGIARGKTEVIYSDIKINITT